MTSIMATDELHQLLEPRVTRFRGLLSEQQIMAFDRTSIVDVKRHIIAMQRNQDQKKTLMDLSRLQAFIEAMSQFSVVCEDVEMGRPELSCFIWGPLMFILRVSHRYSIIRGRRSLYKSR